MTIPTAANTQVVLLCIADNVLDPENLGRDVSVSWCIRYCFTPVLELYIRVDLDT